MRRWIVIGVVTAQALVLAAMAGEREWIVRTGEGVWLRTAPVDPRDLFRGDYVALEYEVSHVEADKLRGALADPQAMSRELEKTVYAALRRDESGIAEVESLSDARPAGGLCLRGRLERYPRWMGTSHVVYGIEAMFVEQGKGLEIEQARNREDVQVPMEVEVAVSSSGVAVLRGWRWSRLGLGLRIEPLPRPPAGTPPPDPRAPGPPRPYRITLKLANVSDRPLAVVDLPDHASFPLVPIRGTATRWKPTRRNAPPPPRDEDVKFLEPGQSIEVRLDLAEPQWIVEDALAMKRNVGQLSWEDWFRLVYTPPNAEACRNLRNTELIWHGQLPSRAISGARSVD
jgi:uncharacterized membrane-anchored protein